MKDPTTGLWMVAVSFKTCNDSKGFLWIISVTRFELITFEFHFAFFFADGPHTSRGPRIDKAFVCEST